MFDRMIRQGATALAPFLTVVLMLSAANSLFAQGNASVQRVFAAWLNSGAQSGVCPDFLGQDSRRIVVTGPANFSSSFEYFAAPGSLNIPDEDWQIRDQNDDVILDLRDTFWSRATTLHIGSQGPESGAEFWWSEPVDPGVTCKTGPNGTVIVQKTFLIKLIDDSGDPNDGAWYVVASGADRQICVGIAMFNR